MRYGIMANATQYDGVERRTGFERRVEAPRQVAAGPKLLASIAVAGEGTFSAGQEKQFKEAVDRVNKSQSEAGKPPLVNLDALEARGVISGFGRAAEIEYRSTRGRQIADPAKPERVDVENDRYAGRPAPGNLPFDQQNPLPPAPGTPGHTAFEGAPSAAQAQAAAEQDGGSRGGGARRGGAGRAGGRSGSKARGERSRAER
jgi:hypothetical protein